MNPLSRVVVIGASGNIGTAVLRRLAAEPALQITAVARRTPPPTAQLSPPYDAVDEWVSCDIGLPENLPRLTEAVAGADAVLHLAWTIQPSHTEPLLTRTNVEGSQHVADAVAGAGVRHLVYLSSIGTYAGGAGEQRVDESWSTAGVPASSYSRHKAAVERILDRLEAEHPELTVTRFRPALVFQRTAASEIVRYFLGPLMPMWPIRYRMLPVLPMDERLRFQVVHAADVAEAVAAALHRRAGGPFNLAAEPVVTPADLAALLDARLIPVDARLLRAAAAAAWRLRLQPSEPGWIDLAVHAPLLSTERARRELDWKPAHEALATLEELLAGMAEDAGAASPPLRTRRSRRAEPPPPRPTRTED